MMRLAVVLLTVLAIGCSAGSSPTGPTPAPPTQAGPSPTQPSAPIRTAIFVITVPERIMAGEWGQAKAEKRWSDGAVEDLTLTVPWTSSFPNVAFVNDKGAILGLKSGSTQIYLKDYNGTSQGPANRTIVEDNGINVEVQVVSPANGATLKLFNTGQSLTDRLVVAYYHQVPAEWQNGADTLAWVCFNNRAGYRIVGSCDQARPNGKREFRPALYAAYHGNIEETDRVTIYLTTGLSHTQFNRLSESGDPYQLPEKEPGILTSRSVPLTIKWQQ